MDSFDLSEYVFQTEAYVVCERATFFPDKEKNKQNAKSFSLSL